MYTVFVTGGIGSGKSVFTARLAQRGAALIDLDQINRSLLDDPEVQDDLEREFGSGVVVAGTVVRSELARRAFSCEETTQALNAIMHPRILDRLAREITGGCRCLCAGPKVTVVEFQLIEHAGETLALADEVVCVSASREQRRENAVARGMAPEDFDARDARQLTDEERLAWCTTVIQNDGSLEALLRKADAWWEAREAAGWACTHNVDGDDR